MGKMKADPNFTSADEQPAEDAEETHIIGDQEVCCMWTGVMQITRYTKLS